jgi:hypothetical protein
VEPDDAGSAVDPANAVAKGLTTFDYVKLVIGYGLAFIGLAIVLYVFTRAFSGNAKYPVARLNLTNLLRTDPYRVEGVCKNMPGTLFEGIGLAMKTAIGANTRDPNVIVQATRPAYDAAVAGVTQRWKQMFGKAKLGAMMSIGGAALVMSTTGKPSYLTIGAAALAVIGGVVVFVTKAETDRSLILARAEILPEVERVFVEGRYRAG